MRMTRRTVLVLGLGGVAGCASRAGGSGTPSPAPAAAAATPSNAPSSSPSISSSGSPAALPGVRRWQPSPGDLEPGCKGAAVRHVERLGTGPGSVVEVIDAQYGGLLASSASVLVVTRSWHRADGRIVGGGHTYDVRLSRHGSGWRVDATYPSRPGPRNQVPAATRRVLGSDRIDLPPAARRDLESGRVHAAVVSALLTVSATHRIGVSVIRSGHPLHVFGTTRLSDHPRGRAFDTWRIDGHPVVDPRTPRGLVTDYMHAVAAAGSYNVGGPYLLGAAPQWFSDDTHHDHVHAGFSS